MNGFLLIALRAIAGLRPWEYWHLTISEIAAMLSGVAERDEKDRELVAWQSALLMNISGKSVKKAVTVDGLLGRTAKQFPMSDKETFDELMRRQKVIDEKKRLADGH